jgi:pimeloyl-ACP methyl ester carboxylesterase
MIRSHFFVKSTLQHDAHIHVRSVVPANLSDHTPSIICLHGAGMHNITFDVQIDDGQPTFLEYLAQQGFAAYAISYRGYGESSKPPAFNLPPLPRQSVMRSQEACQDILDVLNHLQGSIGTIKFNLCGLSWGSIMAGSIASRYPELVDKVVLMAAVYSYPNPAWIPILNPVNLQKMNPTLGTYRIVSKNQITASWDAEIPVTDKNLWRSQHAVDLVIESMLAGDREWVRQQQPELECLRIPTGVIEDCVEIYNQRPLYNASRIHCPVLILRGAYDSTSHPLDMENLLRQLNSSDKKMITFGDATHYAMGEKNAFKLWEETVRFFKG